MTHSRYVPLQPDFAKWIHEIYAIERLYMLADPKFQPTITPMALAMLMYADWGHKEEAATIRRRHAKYLQIDTSFLEGLRYYVPLDS